MSRSLPAFGLVLAAASSLAFFPSAAEAQKGLVYCPVSIDATGCGPIVTALTSSFPDGVETAYDGSSGTVDLATADLSAYAVLVVPSLADGAGVEPYGLLRDPAIAARLSAAFTGRSAAWSGTPDHGSTNRAAKDALLRNLAGWARADAAAGRGAGVVVLQDNSDDAATRYGWLSGISGLAVAADTTFEVYSNVQTVTSTGQTILNNGGLQIGYTNMASYGLVASGGAGNDATGGRTTRVVLVTKAGETSASTGGLATVVTDKEDYQPGDTVTVTGTGWDPGETVSLLFHEDADPPVHPDKTYTAVADADGHISNHDYEIDELDLNVRFTLEATGLTSGKTAQTTFTDATDSKTVQAQTAFSPVTSTVTNAILYSTSDDCTVGGAAIAGAPFSIASAAPTTIANLTNTNGHSVKLTARGTATNPSTGAFLNWTTTSNSNFTPVTGDPLSICVPGTNGNQIGVFVANYLTSSTSLASSLNPSLLGQSVTFTATVTSLFGGTATTGTVTFKDGATTLSTTPVNGSGVAASTPVSTLTVGNHSITATYNGSGNLTASTSSVLTQTVNGAPDLTINKSHSGNFTVGTAASYSITVTNSGTAITTAALTVTDNLPASLSFVSGSGTGWDNCTAAAQTVTCVRPAGNTIAAGTSAPAITLTVTPTAAGAVTNVASVSGGGEVNTANNSASDPTTVLAGVDLTINKSHTGNFTLGVNGTYTLVVANGGGTATTGTITMTDVLPTGLGFVSGTGTGWSCGSVSGTVTCTRTVSIGAGVSAPNISLVVSVTEAAFPSVTNTASVSGGGEPAANNGNNSDSDPTTVLAPDLTINKSHTGNFTAGINGTYSLSVANAGGAVTNANVTVTDVLPTGLGFVSGTGTGWNACTAAAQTVTCVRPSTNTIAAGGTAPAITLTVSVGAAAVPSVTNTASVSGGGEPAANSGNNSDSDPTTVGTGVDLTIDKSHTGNFNQGLNGTYSLTVSNTGGTATSANVTVTDVLPTGLGFVSGTGTGWNACTVATQTVTCVRPAANTIAAGGTAPAITLTVSVAGAAVPSVTNTATVAGGGEPAANNGNNSDSDPTTVIAANSPPVVDAGGPYTGDEGSAIPLNTATATDPDAGDTPTYKWTYVAAGPIDLGTTCSFSNDAIVQPSFTCNDDGSFTVTLTVNDGHSHIVHDDAGVTVNNVKPTAAAGGPYTDAEGTAIQLAGSGDDPGNNDDAGLTYKWTINAAGIDAGGTCTFDDDTKKDAKVTCTDDSNAGHFTLSLVVKDDDGGTSVASTADLTVTNAKPVANAGGGTTGYSGDEGSAILLDGSANDPGDNDDASLTYKWTVNTTGIDAGGTCTFDDATKKDAKVTCTDDSKAGTFTLTLVATDKDGDSSTGSDATLTVANIAPVAEAGGPYDGNEGSPVSLHGSATDVGSNDTFTWKWVYEAGVNVDAGATCSFSDIHAPNPTITCTDDGTVKLTLTVKDDNGGESDDEATLTLANLPPIADAGSPVSGEEGSSIQLHGSANDPGDNDDPYLTYKWTVNTTGIDAGGHCDFVDDTDKNTTVKCTDDSDNATGKHFILSLVATDDDGGISQPSTTNLTVTNADPVADAGGGPTKQYSGNEGSPVNLDGSATDAGSNDTFTWSWKYVGVNVDPGATCSFSDPDVQKPTITCTDDGEVKVTLKVTDDDGGFDTDDATITLANLPPVADAGSPASGAEGSWIQLHGSANDPGDNDDAFLTYKWTVNTTGIDLGGHCDFEDDTDKDTRVKCTDDSDDAVGKHFTLSLVATDDDQGVSQPSTTNLTVTNVDPVANAGGGTTKTYSGNEGSAIQLYGSATDAGSNDTFTWSWEYTAGPGFINGATCQFDDANAKQPKITCNDNGTVELKLTVADDDGGKDDDAATLTVKNVNPVATAGAPSTGDEGSAILLNGSATDAGANDVITYKWTADVTGITSSGHCTFDDATKKDAKVTCDDNGALKLTLTATDDDGGVGTDVAEIAIANVDPVANAGGGTTKTYSGNEGSAVQLYGSATDAGSNDTFEWSWQFTAGDGFINGATCSFDNATDKQPKITCNDNGTVKLTLTVTDDDGGEGVDGATLNVANVAPVAHAGGPYTAAEGEWKSLNGSATDVGTNDTFTYLWTVTPTGIDAGGSCSFDYATKKDAKVKCTDDSNGGKFTLTLVATDDDGGVSVASTADLTVTNANPVAVAGGPYSGNEGAAISLTGSKSDAGSNDTHTYLWTYAVVSGVDAGATCSFSSATVLNPTITCTDDGSYKVTLTVTDDDLGAGSNDATLTLQNVKPTIASLTKPDGTALPTTIIVAGTLPIKVSFSDPATNDTHTAQIDCGLGYINISGNVTTGFQTSCTFATIGPKTIKVKVTDDDAGYDEKSLIMTVKYLFDGFYAPVDRPNTMNLSKAGQAIPLKWRLTNALGAPITDLTGVTVQAVGISCGLSTTTDQIEEYAAGASGLQNQGNGNYQFNWKTPSTYANSCKSIALVFGAGGTSYTENPSAYFTFKP